MYKKILAPIDIQHRSSWITVLPTAVHEAQSSEGAEIFVMTVVPDPFTGVDWRYVQRDDKPSTKADQKKMMKMAKERLEEIIEQTVPRSIAVELVVSHGTPYESIVETAAEIDVDLIVMAASRPSLKDYLLGPTAARVVRHADCSVLVVRSPGSTD